MYNKGIDGKRQMAPKKKDYKIKTRNWHAVSAHFRTSAGGHKDKTKYNRKNKHKKVWS